jgi:hypothetical protein
MLVTSIFTSDFLTAVTEKPGIQHEASRTFHPQSRSRSSDLSRSFMTAFQCVSIRIRRIGAIGSILLHSQLTALAPLQPVTKPSSAFMAVQLFFHPKPSCLSNITQTSLVYSRCLGEGEGLPCMPCRVTASGPIGVEPPINASAAVTCNAFELFHPSTLSSSTSF